MSAGIEVIEVATPENFKASSYLAINPDLRRAFGEDAVLALRHLTEYGLKEGRRQISTAFLSSRRDKFVLFEPTLPATVERCFPVSFATKLHEVSEYPTESSGRYGYFEAELAANEHKLYADIGAGFRHVAFMNCAYVEVYPSLTADILIDDDCRLPFKDASLDGIGCFAVLEHVTQPWRMVNEFARVVKPEGRLFIDWPFLQPVHGYPSHYYNATREGLRKLFDHDFTVSELYTGPHQGPDYTVRWILNALLSSISDPTIREQLSQTTVGDLCAHSPQSEWWQRILGDLDDRAISMLSCGNTLIGSRR